MIIAMEKLNKQSSIDIFYKISKLVKNLRTVLLRTISKSILMQFVVTRATVLPLLQKSGKHNFHNLFNACQNLPDNRFYIVKKRFL